MLFLFLISIFGDENFVQSSLRSIDKFQFQVPSLCASISSRECQLEISNGSDTTEVPCVDVASLILSAN